MALLDDLGVVRVWNAAFRQITGIRGREILGRPLSEAVNTVLAAGSPWRAGGQWSKDRRTLRDGAVVRWRGVAQPYLIRAHKIDSTHWTLSAVPFAGGASAPPTHDSSVGGSSFAAFMRETPDAVLVTDASGTVLDLNGVAESLLGVARDAACGVSIGVVMRLTREGVEVGLTDLARRLVGSGRTARFIRQTWAAGARDRTVEVNAYLIPFGGSSGGVLVMLRDVAWNRHLRHETLFLERARAMNEAASGLAHDLNDCATALQGRLTTAQHLPADELSSIIPELAAGTRQVTRLVGQFQRFFMHAATRDTDSTAEVVRDAIELALRGSGVLVEASIADPLPPPAIPNDALGHLLFNLLSNARDASEDGDTVQVTVRNLDIYRVGEGRLFGIEIAVSDEGFGIAPHHLPRVWEPYFTTKEHSAGMGLSVVAWLVNEAAGTYQIRSEPGFGTTVTIWIPLRAGAVAAAGVRKSLPSTVFAGKRVLVVEDEPLVRSTLCGMLSTLHCEVHSANTGIAAVDTFRAAHDRSDSFDVVIIDQTLPGGRTGSAALAHMQQLNPLVRAILTTGHSHLAEDGAFRRLGFHAVLPKPFDLEHLRMAMQSVLLDAPS